MHERIEGSSNNRAISEGVCLVRQGYPDLSLAGDSGLAAAAILGPSGGSGGTSMATGLTRGCGLLSRLVPGPGLLTMLDP